MDNRPKALALFVGLVLCALAVVFVVVRPRTFFVQVLVPAQIPHDRTVRVVAEAPARLRLTTNGKDVVVAAGLFIYRARKDGSLELVGEKASYVPMMGELEPLGGFATPKSALHDLVAIHDGALISSYEWSEEAGRLFSRTYRIAGKRPERVETPELSALTEWRGAVVGIVNVAGRPTPWVSTGQAKTMPEGAYPVVLAHGHADSLVAFGFAKDGLAAFVWKSLETVEPVVVDMRAFFQLGNCHVVPSFDGELYVAVAKEKSIALYTLADNERWTAVTTPPLEDGIASVDAEGALYRATELTDRLVVERCPKNGTTCRALPIDAGVRRSPTAWFTTDGIDAWSPGRRRSWEMLSVFHSDEAPIQPYVQAIVARNEEDVWLLSRDGDALWHSGPFRDRVRLAYGDSVEARNESAPTSWSGHCEEVFVVLAEARDEATLDPARIDRADLKKRLDDPTQTYAWKLVQGRLFDVHVIGVVLSHRRPETKIEVMEAKTTALVDAFTKNPVDRPRVTCTMPVLDRAL